MWFRASLMLRTQRTAMLLAGLGVIVVLPLKGECYFYPLSPKTWASDSIGFSINPTDFPNGPQRDAVINGIASWWAPNIPATRFKIAIADIYTQRDPENHADGANTIGYFNLPFPVLGHAIGRPDPNDNTKWIELDISVDNIRDDGVTPTHVAPSSTADPFPPYDNYDLEGTVRHECGHAVLSYGGHEDRAPRISVLNSAYGYGGSNEWWMHGDERNGMRTIYPAAGSEVDVQLTGWRVLGVTSYPVAKPSPADVETGDSVAVELTVENLGTESFSGYLDYYLSKDDAIFSAADSMIYYEYISDLPPASGGNAIVPVRSITRKLFLGCGLTPGYYTIIAILNNGGGGESRQSNNYLSLPTKEVPESILVYTLAPPAPVGVTATRDGCASISIGWDDNSVNELGFRIYRNAVLRDSVGPDVEIYADNPPLHEVEYGYQVQAIGSKCSSALTETVYGVVRDPGYVPAGVTASSDRCDGIKLRWSYPGLLPPDGFYISRDDSTQILPAVIPGGAGEWVDTGILQGTTHRYWVRAYTSCGTSPLGAAATGYYPTFPVPVASASSGNCAGIIVSWSWSGGSADSFQVFRSGAHVWSVGGSSFSWLDSSPEAMSGSQSYQVRARFSGSCLSALSSPPVVGTRFREVQYTVVTSVVGAVFIDNGIQKTMAAGGVAAACTTCTASASRTLSVDPTQVIGGNRYCFDGWQHGDGWPRTQNLTVLSDTTFSFALTTSGQGPTVYPAGTVTFRTELTDCQAPYTFEGDASFLQGLTVYPSVTLRFTPLPGTPTGPVFKVYGAFSATDAIFETTESSANTNTKQWSGITLYHPFTNTIDIRRCRITNANAAIGTNGVPSLVWANVDSCTFAYNETEVQGEFTHEYLLGARFVRVARNYFQSKVGVDLRGAHRPFYPSEPYVPASIDSNTFAPGQGVSSPTFAKLVGGFSGHLNANNVSLAKTGSRGVVLDEDGSGYPSVSLTQNWFQTTNNRTALQAPRAAGHPILAAYYNRWSQCTTSDIKAVIADYWDAPFGERAEVAFEPWNTTGCGGGGGGGCPFVFSVGTEGDLRVENSILGRSELAGAGGGLINDAIVLRHARVGEDGFVRVRIEEFEEELDVFDAVGVEAIEVPEGTMLAVDPGGRIVGLRQIPQEVVVSSWAGRNAPFVSPVGPGSAYRGEPGDSLEVTLNPLTPRDPDGLRRVYISMVPKPQEASSPPGSRLGVTIRVASDQNGTEWETFGAMIPRALWDQAVLPVDLSGDALAERVRIIWNTSHTLGWVGLAEEVPLGIRTPLALVSATHSSQGHVGDELKSVDEAVTTLMPGEHIDLAFDASPVQAGTQLALVARGRYELGSRKAAASIPSAPYLSQNSPNPFNPVTKIGFGLPTRASARVQVFDVSGRLVRTLVDREVPAGEHSVYWMGEDDRGNPVASGVYFYQIQAGSFTSRHRMVLVR